MPLVGVEPPAAGGRHARKPGRRRRPLERHHERDVAVLADRHLVAAARLRHPRVRQESPRRRDVVDGDSLGGEPLGSDDEREGADEREIPGHIQPSDVTGRERHLVGIDHAVQVQIAPRERYRAFAFRSVLRDSRRLQRGPLIDESDRRHEFGTAVAHQPHARHPRPAGRILVVDVEHVLASAQMHRRLRALQGAEGLVAEDQARRRIRAMVDRDEPVGAGFPIQPKLHALEKKSALVERVDRAAAAIAARAILREAKFSIRRPDTHPLGPEVLFGHPHVA